MFYLLALCIFFFNYQILFQTNPDDEEDILSKNSRELQIKRQNSTGSKITETHEIPNSDSGIQSEAAGSSGYSEVKKWETFDEENSENPQGYERINENWEKFDEETEEQPADGHRDWVKFKDENTSLPKVKSVELKNSFRDVENSAGLSNSTSGPMPLFTDTPVNNNTTYSYDVLEQEVETIRRPAVFMPTTESNTVISSFELLKRPTFYKSLLTVMTTKFSIFVFYTLFPVYLYEELQGLKIRQMSSLMGILSISNLLFSGVSYWVNIDKKRRPICMWILCWLGSFGYFSKFMHNLLIYFP